MEEPPQGFRFLEHTADIRVEAWGKTRAELFRAAALGMMQYMFVEELNASPHEILEEQFVLHAPDADCLLVDFLSRVLLSSLTRRCCWTSVAVHDISGVAVHDISGVAVHDISEQSLDVTLRGSRAAAQHEIKAVTYHGLHVQHRDGQWRAVVTLDI